MPATHTLRLRRAMTIVSGVILGLVASPALGADARGDAAKPAHAAKIRDAKPAAVEEGDADDVADAPEKAVPPPRRRRRTRRKQTTAPNRRSRRSRECRPRRPIRRRRPATLPPHAEAANRRAAALQRVIAKTRWTACASGSHRHSVPPR
jgi:hypothetical protein